MLMPGDTAATMFKYRVKTGAAEFTRFFDWVTDAENWIIDNRLYFDVRLKIEMRYKGRWHFVGIA